MSSTAVLGDIEILSDVMNCGTPDFDTDAARAVLCLGFSESQKSQMLELADKKQSRSTLASGTRANGELSPRWELPGVAARSSSTFSSARRPTSR